MTISGLPAAPVAVPPPRRRRRWPWVSGIVVIVLVGLVVGGEFLARTLVAQQVRAQVITALQLPADQQLDVTVGGIVLPQLIAGRLDELQLSSQKVALGPIVGAVSAEATGVPIRGGALDSASGMVTIDAAQLETIVRSTSLPVDAVTLVGADVKASGSVTLLGPSLPLALTLTPGAESGALTLTPTSATVGTVTVASKDTSAVARLLKPLFATQRVCIADRLPAGVHLSALRVDGNTLVASFAVDGAITADEQLQQPGTC